MTKKIAMSVLHAVWLLVLTWFWLNDFRVLGDEQALIKWSTVVKRVVLKVDGDLLDPNEILFINTDHDLALIDRKPNPGKAVITDRRLLADAFRVLNRFPDAYRYIVCDIDFDGTSEADAALRAELAGMKRVIFPAHRGKDGAVQPDELAGLKLPSALADYQSVKGTFYKWQLMSKDGAKTLPLALYERLSGKTMKKAWGLYWVDGKPCFNRMIIDLKIRPSLLNQGPEDAGYTQWTLDDLTKFEKAPESVIKPLIRDRIIVIGALTQRDTHRTALGAMGGPLILMNVYYGLVQGQHHIAAGMIILLLATYTLISYHIFYKIPIRLSDRFQEFLKTKFGAFFAKYLSILGILTLASILCYAFWDAHINILFITVYIGILKKLQEKFTQPKTDESGTSPSVSGKEPS